MVKFQIALVRIKIGSLPDVSRLWLNSAFRTPHSAFEK